MLSSIIRKHAAPPVLLAALLVALGGCGASAEEDARPAQTASALEIRFFDAGKADAALLTTANGTVLIDAGERGFGGTILAYLEEKGVERIDYLIVTHFDRDHVGGAAKVINGIPVGTVLQNDRPGDSEEYRKYVRALRAAKLEPVTVRETCAFTLDGVSYTVEPPPRAEYASDASNNASLIVSVQNGENRFLFMGDAMTERLREFLGGSVAPCDVLKAPHHGRDEPLLAALLAAVKPAFAVVTSSDEKPEDAAALDALEQAGVRTFLTREGAVTARSDGRTVTMLQ